MGERSVTVTAGDNLWAISKRMLGAGHRWPEIYAVNRTKIKDPNLIRVGQVLAIPSASRHGLSDPHPLQRSRPRIASLQGRSAPHVTADLGVTSGGAAPEAVLKTTVNSPAFKFDLKKLPSVSVPFVGGIATLSWTGQVYLWRDAPRPLASIGNRGLELSEKVEAATVLGKLLATTKLTFDPKAGVSYEDMMSLSSYGRNPVTVSSGVVMTQASPVPKYRTQIKIRLMEGKYRDWLFGAVEFGINFDIELVPPVPSPAVAARPALAPVPALQPAPAFPGRVTGDVGPGPQPGGLQGAAQGAVQWTQDHQDTIVKVAAVVAVAAVVVLAVSALPVEAIGALLFMGARTAVQAGA